MMATSTAATGRRRNGQVVLPIIYMQPQSRTQRFLPLVIVASCGVWIFAMGALLERLPPGRAFPDDMTAKRLPQVTTSMQGTPVRVLKETDLDEDNQITTRHAVEHTSTTTTTITTKSATQVKTESPSATNEQKYPPTIGKSHQIPNVLIFTHNVNLLQYNKNQPDNQQENRTKEEQQELLALQKNIHATIDKHPRATVRFLTDKDCVQSLQAALGPNAPLIDHFRNETMGMYKADICRGAALWETGGIYLDVDVGVRMHLLDVLQPNTTFATSLVHRDSKHPGNFFQAFMATTPRHAILERYLQLFLEHYQGTRPIQRGPLGVILLRQAFDDVIMSEGEIWAMNGKPVNDKDKSFRLGPKLVDTRHHGRIQLWQEVLYNPKFLSNVVPAPTWGTRRACHFVVVADQKFPLTVPLYSRIEGSRMCPRRSDAQMTTA
ncbi:expressed unknown protein [Seminavis robusta]|uniref:Glycosyltransferase n=1 Tax=Seminavis robusta TaxID=568900 RepID=A0A9N8H5Y4_9STRA|nr:expressed unknown protein [Seminavis robusta]|eukprot:Sro128_g061280.1 n/a (436) ;mRNA; r:71508-72815